MVVLAWLASSLSAQATTNAVGTWKAVFVGPIGPQPKMVASNWPGELDVSDLKFEGDRLSFTGTGKKGWRTGIGGVVTDHCCPKLKFDGTITRDEMTLLLTWGSTESDDASKAPLPMEAKRLSR
jgi:hypothetical protein